METFMRELTAKQKQFCDGYLSGLNITQAALRAGYSRTTADNGCLMNMPKIRKYIAAHSAGGDDIKVSHDRVLQQLCKIAFASIGDCFYPGFTLKPMDDIGPDTMSAIELIVITRKGDIRVKMYNKMAALEKIAKRTGFYLDIVKPKPAVEIPEPAADAKELPDQNDDFDLKLIYKDAEDYMAKGVGLDEDAEEETAREEVEKVIEKTEEARRRFKAGIREESKSSEESRSRFKEESRSQNQEARGHSEEESRSQNQESRGLKADDGNAAPNTSGKVKKDSLSFNPSAIKPGNPFYKDGWEKKSYNCCE